MDPISATYFLEGKIWHLFVEGDVFEVPQDLPVGTFRPYLWTFVGADGLDAVPKELPAKGPKVFTIFTTSPKRS